MPETEDAQYRKVIIEDLDHSLLVEAGAGSGKTTSLVNRMLALIGRGRCTVDQMAAVTYTRKAAAELKDRFQIALEEAFKKEIEEESRSRYQSALMKLELLFAGTIHSFCARILRERPIEAGLDPDFEELEENDEQIIRDRCWSEYLERLHLETSPLLEEVIALDLEPSEMIDIYQKMALYPEVEVVRKKLKRPDFKKETKTIEAYLEQAWKVLPQKIPEGGWDPLQSILRKIRRLCYHLDLEKDLVRIISELDKSGSVVQKKWATKETALQQGKAFEKIREEIVQPCLESWRRYCHWSIMELVLPALNYFKETKEKNSYLGFQDLLLKSAELLRENPEVRGYFQSRFTHILVDEFQDTDPIQTELLLYLTGKDLKERNWRKIKVKPGALFVVGDPKQSIYRFRRADIDIYNEMQKIIKSSGGWIIPLTTNFRSLPALCQWVNPIFEKKFLQKADQYQAAFEPLVADKKIKGGGVKKIIIQKVNRHNQVEVARVDAERIADWIDWALRDNFEVLRTKKEMARGESSKPGPGDFMILLRYTAHLPIYARALEARGIPYEITGGKSFKESEEISHLMHLLASVAEPEDQVALIATLRGPFYGISDDLLYQYKKGGGAFSYLVPTGPCQDEVVRQKMRDILTELHQFHRWSRTKPPATALTMILDKLGIIPLALSREMGESRAGNLLKTLELALWESSGGLNSFPEMVERLRLYFQETDMEEMSVEPGRKDVVRVMNLHKAKGLEATVVFLADPLKDPDHSPDLHISRTGDYVLGYFLASRQKGEFRQEIIGIPPDWENVAEIEGKYQQAEEERLLYVATTRAKQLLVVSQYPEKGDKGGWKELYSFLGSVDELEGVDQAPIQVKKGRIALKDFLSGKEQVKEKAAISMKPSYTVESVTKASKGLAEGRPIVAEDTGKGLSWGRIIHRLLEVLVRNEKVDLELMTENLLIEEGRSITERESAISLVKSILSSELWGRMKKAEQVLVEVPFSLKIDEGELPQVVSGVIDLAFLEIDGWVIADYKTDTVNGNLEGLIRYYKPQVEMYRKFWEEMSGEKVKEAGMFFTDINQWIKV